MLYGGRIMKCKVAIFAAVLLGVIQPAVHADDIIVAVASNFTATLQQIAQQFEAGTDHEVTIVSGATGRHYAQIINGAPYDLFFAADAETPARLAQEGRTQGEPMTYAQGRVALWSRNATLVDDEGAVLRTGGFRSLAIANPRLAPYGQAAVEVLENMGLYQDLESRLVMGENIAQTFQFVDTENAQLGFVAYSQVLTSGQQGSWWLVPSTGHSPLTQDVVLLTDNPVARDFLQFITQEEATTFILESGYEPPAD